MPDAIDAAGEVTVVHETDRVTELLKRVKSVESDGVHPQSNTIGFHGICLDTLQYILNTGRLPGAIEASDNPALRQLGDLYFVPIAERIPHGVVAPRILSSTQASFDEVVGYASDISEFVEFFKNLGLDPYNPEFRKWEATMVSHPDRLDLLKDAPPPINQFTTDQLLDAYDSVKSGQGFVLGFDEKVVSLYPVSQGDGKNDLRISTSDGIPLELITEIYPIGDTAKNFVNQLRGHQESVLVQ